MSSLTQPPLEALMDAVYDAAFEPEGWQRVCDLFDAVVGGAYVSIATHDLSTNRSLGAFYARHQDEFYRSYRDYYDQRNLFVDAMRSRSSGVPLSVDDLVPKDVLMQSEFYRDWLRPQENLSAGGVFMVSNQHQRMTLFSAMLPQHIAGKNHDKVMATLGHLAPHMQRSLRLNVNAHKVANKASILETFMEEARAAFLVLDQEGRPLEANRQARTLFDNGVLSLDLAGTVVMNTNLGTDYIASAVREAVAGTNQFGDGVEIDIEEGSAPAWLRAIPLGSQGKTAVHHLLGTRSTAAVIISIASSQPMLKAAKLRFGLSPAEAAVLQGLVEGKGLKDLAAERKTSINTLRNQVASLLDKTKTSSQKELVGLFATGRRL